MLVRRKTLIPAAQVVKIVPGDYNPRTVLNGDGIFKQLRRFQESPRAKVLYDLKEVNELADRIYRGEAA